MDIHAGDATDAQPTERDRASGNTVSSAGVETPAEERARPPRSRFSVLRRASQELRSLPGVRPAVLLLVCVCFLVLLQQFVAQPYRIPSDSMEPAFRPGDRVMVNKLAYRFGAQPRRGDAVVFDGTGYFGDGGYIKRVAGVGGDHVVCCDTRGRIAVNGRPVDEPYVHPGDTPSTVPFDVQVPDGSLFVLGDHRDVSRDSRDHLGSPGGGMIPLDRVIGRADWTVWPASRWARHPRPGAFDDVPAPEGAHG